MSTQIQRRRGTTTEHGSFTGALAELTVDTTKDTVVVHDGTQVGGFPLLREDGSNSALALGSAGTPSLKFTGDTNTGIYSPGADQVAISTNGTGRLFVDSSGRVGVGTASVGAKLHVVGGNAANCLIDNDGSQYTQLLLQHNGTANTGGDLLVDSSPGEPQLALRSLVGPLCFHTSSPAGSNAERARITADGKLGLGSSSPGSLLELSSAATSAVGGVTVTNTNAAGYSTVQFKNTGASGRTYTLSLGGNTSAFPGSVYLYDDTAGASRLLVDSSGRVGIGTATPSSLLHLSAANSASFSSADFDQTYNFLRIVNTTNDKAAGIYFGIGTNGEAAITAAETTDGETALVFGTRGGGARSERARIDSSGRLLVGTSTSVGSNALVSLVGSASTNTSIYLGRYQNASTIAAAGATLGFLEFGSADGGLGAEIRAISDGVWSSTSDCPTRLVFSTTKDSESSPTERMRIDSSGNVMFRTTSSNPFNNNSAFFNVAGYLGVNHINATVSGTGYVAFNYNSGEIGSITQNGTTAVSYNTTSDYRLKENVVSLTGAADRLNQLQVRRFNFIAEPDRTVDGFIAHEAQAVVPECVTGEKDAVDDEGNPIYQGIDQSKLVPLLTAALQEALAKIEVLEQRFTDAGIA